MNDREEEIDRTEKISYRKDSISVEILANTLESNSQGCGTCWSSLDEMC